MPAPLPRGRLRWFGVLLTDVGGGELVEELAALVVFDSPTEQQQFLNTGTVGLEFEGDDSDTLAHVLDANG